MTSLLMNQITCMSAHAFKIKLLAIGFAFNLQALMHPNSLDRVAPLHSIHLRSAVPIDSGIKFL